MLFGRLAQLVEHPLDVREVTGSSPVSSTIKTAVFEKKQRFFSNFFAHFPLFCISSGHL